jgi:hypothetical protein
VVQGVPPRTLRTAAFATPAKCERLLDMSDGNNLLGHLISLCNHPNIKPDSSLKMEITLNSGLTCSGQLHEIFDDGLAIMDGGRIIYVPLAGLSSLAFGHPGFSQAIPTG